MSVPWTKRARAGQLTEILSHGDPGTEVVVGNCLLVVPYRRQPRCELVEGSESHPLIEGTIPRDIPEAGQRHGREADGGISRHQNHGRLVQWVLFVRLSEWSNAHWGNIWSEGCSILRKPPELLGRAVRLPKPRAARAHRHFALVRLGCSPWGGYA
jgi:hypothetical protein